jgi:hypothetical protein
LLCSVTVAIVATADIIAAVSPVAYAQSNALVAAITTSLLPLQTLLILLLFAVITNSVAGLDNAVLLLPANVDIVFADTACDGAVVPLCDPAAAFIDAIYFICWVM